MIKINLNTQKNCKLTLFPDNQPHVSIEPNLIRDDVNIICSITDSKKLLELCMLKNALEEQGLIKSLWLTIPYLMGARFDRVMNPGDSFDLRVISRIINSLEANEVYLIDPHSDVAYALIDNAYIITNKFLVEEYNVPNSILIVPDAGAAKKAYNYLEWNKNLVDVVQCVKHRDTTDGNITLKVLEPEKCHDRDCIIIDDICDGGRTFTTIAGQIFPKHLSLMVTHGIFSQGFSELEKYFSTIMCSDSYRQSYNSNIVKIKEISSLWI